MDLDLKFSLIVILNILERINSFDHKFETHTNKKMKKMDTIQGTLNSYAKLDFDLQWSMGFHKYLKISEESRSQIWSRGHFGPSKEDE